MKLLHCPSYLLTKAMHLYKLYFIGQTIDSVLKLLAEPLLGVHGMTPMELIMNA